MVAGVPRPVTQHVWGVARGVLQPGAGGRGHPNSAPPTLPPPVPGPAEPSGSWCRLRGLAPRFPSPSSPPSRARLSPCIPAEWGVLGSLVTGRMTCVQVLAAGPGRGHPPPWGLWAQKDVFCQAGRPLCAQNLPRPVSWVPGAGGEGQVHPSPVGLSGL